MAQFYGVEDVDDNFGFSNPFIKDLGLEDKKRLSARKNVIEEAAKVASSRTARQPPADAPRKSGFDKHLEKQLSATQFNPAMERQAFMKRQDASSKAFKPAILQVLAERASSREEDAVVKSIPGSKGKDGRTARPSSFRAAIWGSIFGAGDGKKKSPKMIPPRQQEEVASW